MNPHHQALQLDVQVIDDPGYRIVNFTIGLFTDDRGRNLAAVRPPRLKRIFVLLMLSVLFFGGTAGVGSDLAYAQNPKPTLTLTTRVPVWNLAIATMAIDAHPLIPSCIQK